ncbi:endonuclease, partial [Candidatus Phytoplasma meliae]|nr:endonuclease [Candidatus Phytoplasma meliae]
QLFCSNTKLCYFFVYQSPISYKTLEVKIDQPFIKKMLTDGQTYLHLLSEAKKELSQTKILKTLTRII